MRVLDEQYWSQTTFGEAVAQCPDALVLKPDQSLQPPASWPRYDPKDGDVPPDDREAIAPFWGENTTLSPTRPTTQPDREQ